uniref:Transmembrane protein n=2 Tax=Globisporangium ultimum (strain ATCC 200006 / CBS 805.95 / DAOM BR144) TaxID=431595 RepID=K3X8R0_GLOUD
MAKVAVRHRSFSPKTRQTGVAVKRITRAQVLHLMRRICVLAAAIYYVGVSLVASLQALNSLKGATSPLTVYRNYSANLITAYLGHDAIRESKLVASLLDNSNDATSTPLRNDTMFLESLTTTSFTGCASVAKFNAKIYDSALLRSDFVKLVEEGAYNLSFLSDHELILPVVDCSFTPLTLGDLTCARVFYLTRLKSNTEQMYVITVSKAIVNYAVREQHTEGTATLISFTLVSDMSMTTSVQHYFAVGLGFPYEIPPTYDIYEYLEETEDAKLALQSIPRNPALEPSKIVHTARQRGFYIKSPTDQANVKSMYWPLYLDPVSVMSKWIWEGKTWIRDSWAWVHYIHAVFALSTVYNLCVLFLIMYRNYRLGKIWIGDAFASVSNTLMYRGALVLLSWIVNNGWMITEICFAYGYEFANIPSVYLFTDMPHADIMTLYLCMVDILGYLFKERIDPAFVIAAADIGFLNRVEMGRLFLPTPLKQYSIDRANHQFGTGLVPLSPYFASFSPLRLWTISELPANNFLVITASFSAVFTVFFFIAVAYVLARKQYKRYHPENLYLSESSAKPTTGTHRSEKDSDVLSFKRTLTLFEIATGAELQNRFGVIADYDNFVYFKGLKYASADGIYYNGFVIANGKFLIATEDILTIAVLKLTRIRLRTVYTYEVEGSKLKQTAQVVYPNTLSWKDLLHPNVNILA